MGRVPAAGWWAGLPMLEKRRLHVLALAMTLFCVHYALMSFWFVEDAAITFAFSHHAATGEGFVAWPGGERVEGFSNPTWTLLLAATEWLVGGGPFVASKLWGFAFGLACLPLAYLWARRLVGHRGDLTPALAPLILAVSPQLVVWCASGLENSLFEVLLVAGAVLLLREADSPRFPWSALAWSLLAFTRPEAPMYPAVAGVVGMGFVAARRGPRGAVSWAVRWGALFLAPLLAWHGWRYAYFAWEFPNTYYAKLGDGRRTDFLGWGRRGWRYTRSFALVSAQGFLLPVYLLGQTGLRGWRGRVGIGASAVLLLLVLPGLDWPGFLPFWPLFREPEWLVHVRVGFIASLVLLPLVGLGRRGAMARTLAWGLVAASLFFVLYSGGDWMDAYRLFSMPVIPMAVLFVDGVAVIRDGLERLAPEGARGPRRVAWVLLAVPLVAGPANSGAFLSLPETTPFDVHRRVAYKHQVAERLHLDHVVDAEVDMGAHLWWGGFEIIDIPGLTDVPMAHHKWERAFVREYVFQERVPDFIHSHGGWARRTRFQTHPEFKKNYLEIDPYPVSPWTQHTGNWIRRDLFSERLPVPPPRSVVVFGDVAELVEWQVPAPEVAPGQSLYLEVAWRRGRSRDVDWRPVVFLSNGERLVVRELPPAYDWLPLRKWRRNEKIIGRHTLSLPADLSPGSWDLGFALLSPEAGAVPATWHEPGPVARPPRLAKGEVRWEDAVEVVSPERALELARDDLATALDWAGRGSCETAEEWWTRARRHLSPDHRWQEGALERLEPAMARCWALRAEKVPREPAVEALRTARRWDHRQYDVVRVGRDMADELESAGEALLAREELDGAYAAWRDALWVDPTRSWLRRRTEALRDRRLGLADDGDD